MTNETPAVAPGWYPSNPGSSELRWWDGTRWTEHTVRNQPAYTTTAGSDLRAPEATRPYTVWIWILAVSPLASLLTLGLVNFGQIIRESAAHPTSVTAIYTPGYFLAIAIGWLVYGISVVFAALDYRYLRRAGVPRPFHWAWSFLLSGVYVIGRSVIARRRIGRGIAPLWVWISAYVLTFILTIVIVFAAVAAILPSISSYPTAG